MRYKKYFSREDVYIFEYLLIKNKQWKIVFLICCFTGALLSYFLADGMSKIAFGILTLFCLVVYGCKLLDIRDNKETINSLANGWAIKNDICTKKFFTEGISEKWKKYVKNCEDSK